MTAPVPWSLAWREDGELAPQDRCDLLQSLICNETADVQANLIAAVENLSTIEFSSLSLGDVTSLCA